ncbi:MAG: tyrosinase family protein [Deltaproteobacteria bacterium]|nr:tyrosinase family protein [Deltaproteobacteria bacterium]
MTDPKTGSSRRDFLSLVGLGAVSGAAALTLPYGSAAHAAAAPSCAAPTGKLKSGAGSFNSPIAFKGDSGPLRTRKSMSKLTSAELKKLDAAYKAMRALPASDPRSFANQANIHCWFCGMGEQIHGSYRFFPWHRAYLYFHEKILGALINDPSFALPYWDWANDRAIPAGYRSGNLLNSTRDSACNSGSKTLTDQLVGKAALSRPLGGIATAAFVGDETHGGNLEFGPHGGVHIWAGGDMSQLDTAGRDPLFYGHHNNIDRYWAQWIGSGGGRANPSSSAWLNTSWKFYGPDEKWYVIKVSDVVNYQTTLKQTWNHDPGPEESPEQLYHSPGELEAGGGSSASELNFSDGANLDVNPRTYKASLTATHKKELANSGTPFTLRVQGIDVPTTDSVIVKLHAQDPSSNDGSSADRPQYVGYLAVVARSAGSMAHGGKLNTALDLVPAVRQTISSASDAQLTVVPSSIGGRKPSKITMSHQRIFGHSY